MWIIALVLAALSASFFVPVFSEYRQTGLVDKFPTLMVCGFEMIAAIKSLFVRLVMKTIYQKNRQDFEMELYRVTEEAKNK